MQKNYIKDKQITELKENINVLKEEVKTIKEDNKKLKDKVTILRIK